ncbi:MAG: DHH family phosphoesterase, partial [Thermodesulfobacteriota bacterium]
MQIITTHRNTDFDALASVIAGTILYPDSVAVIPKAINPNVKAFLSIHKDLFQYCHPNDMDLSEVSRMVVVDTNQWGRLEGLKPLKNRDDIEIFIWDHHENDCDMNPSWQFQHPMGANITLMIRAMKESGLALTPIQATLFLCGLYEDTGSLMFPSTTVEDAYAAAYLLEQKADLSILKTFLQPVYGEKQKDILFEMLKSAQRKKINNYTVSINITEISGHINNLSLVVH